MNNIFNNILKFSSIFGIIILLFTGQLLGQVHVQFETNPNRHTTNLSKKLIAVDVFAFGDYDGLGMINSANIIIDAEALREGDYELYKWESCVNTSGNAITYSPRPFQNPILNFVCMEGIANGGRIGTLWFSQKKDQPFNVNPTINLKAKYNDLFVYSKVDGLKLNFDHEIKLSIKQPIKVSVYPNPVVDEVYLQVNSEDRTILNDGQPIDIILYDAAGQKCKKFANISLEIGNQQQLSLRDIPVGTYYLSLMKDNKVLVKSEPIIKAKI